MAAKVSDHKRIKMKKEQYVQVCPKCGSTRVHVDFSNPVVWAYGTTTKYRCESCGHMAPIFPEMPKKEVTHYKRMLKEKMQEHKGDGGNKDIIDTTPGFTIGIFEVLLFIMAAIMLILGFLLGRERGVTDLGMAITLFVVCSYIIWKIRESHKRK